MTTPIPLDDLNHELYQLMRLHREMRSWRWWFYPKTMKRAADVAYAAHLRVMLEFFRNERPDPADLTRVGCPKPNDLSVSELDPASTSTVWTDDELRRLCDSDKLLGHLSKDRATRTSDWGRDEDWVLLRPHVDKLLAAVSVDLADAREARATLR
jgi:hypothetical protein